MVPHMNTTSDFHDKGTKIEAFYIVFFSRKKEDGF